MPRLLSRVLLCKELLRNLTEFGDIKLRHLNCVQIVEFEYVLLVRVRMEQVVVALRFFLATFVPKYQVDPAGQLFSDLLRLQRLAHFEDKLFRGACPSR